MMKEKKRLPVHRVVKNPPGWRRTERDEEVIKAVCENRFMSTTQIAKRFFPSKTRATSRRKANRRLSLMFQHECLGRYWIRESPIDTIRNTETIYFLKKAGAELLAEILQVGEEEFKWYPNQDTLKTDTIEHILGIAEIRVAAELAAAEQGDELYQYIPDWELMRHKKQLRAKQKLVDPVDPRGKKQTVNPDGFYIYQLNQVGKRGRSRHRFFIEYDRGGKKQWDFAQKIKGFFYYRDSQAYKSRFGDFAFRVLTVTEKPRRLPNLKKTTDKLLSQLVKTRGDRRKQKMFYFTSLEKLQNEGLLAPIWLKSKEEGAHKLFRER